MVVPELDVPMERELQGLPLDGRKQHLERERKLEALATRQHGVVARRQLRALGLGREAINSRLGKRHFLPVHRGVYSVGHRRIGIRGNWMAAVLACGEGALLSHRSAAALWGLMRPRWAPVDVTSLHGRRGRKGIRFHEGVLHPSDRAEQAGIPATSLPRTLLDLAEVVDEQRLKRAFEEADRLKLLRMPEMERVCAQAGRRKGLLALRRLVAEAKAPAQTRSPLEDGFAEFYREHLADLPEPLTNVSILDCEVDAYWPGHRLVVELDGFSTHAHRAAFESDRARDAAMQAAGYRVLRFTHRQLETEAPRITTQLRTMLGADPPASASAK